MSIMLSDIMGGENDDDNSDLSEHTRFLCKGKSSFYFKLLNVNFIEQGENCPPC